MILCSHTIGEHEFRFQRPPTSADVLDWLVWCQSARPDPAEFVRRALEWAAQWMQPTQGAQELEAVLITEFDADSPASLAELCNAIAASAAVPASNLRDMRMLLDRRNDVPDDWQPRPLCRCRLCLTGTPNPAGAKCKRDSIEPLSDVLMSYAMGVERADAPYYLEQIRSVVSNAEARRLCYERETREDEAETARILGKYNTPERGH